MAGKRSAAKKSEQSVAPVEPVEAVAVAKSEAVVEAVVEATQEPKQENAKKAAPKKVESKSGGKKVKEAKKEEPKIEAVKKDEPKVEVKKEEPKEPKVEAKKGKSKVEAAKKEEPKVEAKKEEVKVEAKVEAVEAVPKKNASKKQASGAAKSDKKTAPKKKAAKKVAKKEVDPEQAGGVTRTRFFKVVVDGEEPYGRYSGSKPKQAASKALSAIFKAREKEGLGIEGQHRFSIIECTRNSKHKEYKYVGERVELPNPMKVKISKGEDAKEIEYRFNNRVMKDKQ